MRKVDKKSQLGFGVGSKTNPTKQRRYWMAGQRSCSRLFGENYMGDGPATPILEKSPKRFSNRFSGSPSMDPDPLK